MYVMWLRRGGFSFSKIASEVIRACMSGTMGLNYDGPVLSEEHLLRNYNEPKAYKDYRDTLKKYLKAQDDDIEYARAEIEDQLQELLSHAMDKSREGDMYGVQVALQTIQTKTKLLGLNKPEVRRIEGHEGGAIAVTIVQEAAARAEAPDDD